MKNIKTLSILTMVSLAAVLLFNSCKKNSTTYIDYDYVDDSQARIKINYNVAFWNNPGAQIKINGVRVSAANIQTRFPFPGGGFNTLGGSTGDYLPINAGNAEISLSIPKKGTSVDSIAIFKTTVNATGGKYYSLHVADSLERKGLLVEENLTRPDSGFVRYRFTNLMANVPAVDLYIGSVLIMANVPFMTISEPFTLPTSQATISTTWAIRPAGAASTSTALATYNSASTVLNQRVYTVFANGYSGKTDAARKPYVSFYYVL